MKPRLYFALAALAAGTSALAQTTTPASDRLEVSVSRTAQLKIEDAWVNVVFAAPGASTLEAVVKAAEPLSLKETDLQNVTPFFGQGIPSGPVGNRLAYSFVLRLPTTQLSELLQKVDQLRRSLLAADNGIELVNQGVIGFGASDRARETARGPLLSEALAEARSRAESLARAAGLQLGAIAGVTESFATAGGVIGGFGGPPANTASLFLLVRFAVSR